MQNHTSPDFAEFLISFEMLYILFLFIAASNHTNYIANVIRIRSSLPKELEIRRATGPRRVRSSAPVPVPGSWSSGPRIPLGILSGGPWSPERLRQ